MWNNLITFFALLGGTIALYTVIGIINESSIKKEIKKHIANAFKVIITNKGVKKIQLDVFSKDDEKIKAVEIESKEGISENLKIGQIIYCI